MYHTNLNATSCYNFAIYTFRLVELYKSFGGIPPLEIPANSSTIFRSSHQRCFIKKAFLKHFVIFIGKQLCWGHFFNKVTSHQSHNFIKKRLQHRYFLVNIEKFIITLVLKNICKHLHFWKVFCKSIFQIRT